MNDSGKRSQVSVMHNAAHQCFETRVDGEVAYVSYTWEDNRVSFDHTYVPNRFRGQGIAAALVRAALNEAQEQKWKVVPRCSYVAAFIQRNPEFANLVVA